MTRLFLKIAIVIIMVSGGANIARASSLNGEEIENLVEGKRVFLKIPIGGEFPLRYQKDGVVRGDGTAAGLARFFSPKDEGRWWVSNNQLCQKWNEWYKGKTACFILSDLNGKQFRWKRNDGRKGRGRTE